jgi:hypothetical protein
MIAIMKSILVGIGIWALAACGPLATVANASVVDGHGMRNGSGQVTVVPSNDSFFQAGDGSGRSVWNGRVGMAVVMPEPALLGLLGLGIIGIGMLSLRRPLAPCPIRIKRAGRSE